MGLDLEYFKKQLHIKDLKKLMNDELYDIIDLLNKELREFNTKNRYGTKGIIIACENMSNLINDLRFILNGYIDVIKENDLSFFDITDTQEVLTNIDMVDHYLTKVKAVRVSEKINELVRICLLKMRVLYDSIDGYIDNEEMYGKLWNIDRN